MTEFLKSLYKNRYLLFLWIKRELRARYAGSAIGLIWTIILPVATIAIFYVFFALVLKVKIPELPTNAGYFFYLLAGLLPWISISEAINLSATSILGQSQTLKQSVFPVEILPVVPVFTSAIPQAFGTAIYTFLLWHFDCLKPLGLFFWPLIFLSQVLITAGFGLFFSVICVIYRDFVHVLNVGLQLWFYITPILYPESMVPQKFKWMLVLNPLYWLVKCYQEMFINGYVIRVHLMALFAFSMLLFVAGSVLFSFFKPGIADDL